MLDLHVHSSASDGTATPGEMVVHARKIGLEGIALTDHDTCAGVNEAVQAGTSLGVRVMPGVELSAEWKGQDVHILGYWIDSRDSELSELMADLRADRATRIVRMVEKVQSLGMPITLKDVTAQATMATESLGRPHVARALVAGGFVETVKQAFEIYLDRNKPAYVARFKLCPEDAVKIIGRSGGVAVWAHPNAMAETLISRLSLAGLSGLEVYHPEHDFSRENSLLTLARQYGLIVTGGSDAHHIEQLGSRGVVTPTWDALLARR